MATYEFNTLRDKYAYFQHPIAVIKINDVSLSDAKKGYPTSDIQVDLTSGFEYSKLLLRLPSVTDVVTNQTVGKCWDCILLE